MAVPLNMNDLLRLRVVCYTSSQIGVNTVHYRVSAVGGGGATDQIAVNAIDVALAPRMKACLSAQAKYRGCSLQRIRPLPVNVPVLATVNDGPGTVIGDMNPGQVSGLISARSILAARSERARIYIPFPGEADNSLTGNPTAGYVSNIDDVGELLYKDLILGVAPNDMTLTPVIFHRTTATTSTIFSFTARTVWATQRRRGGYGRMNLVPF